MITFGSLFAGIGGLDLGFERAGLECKFQVENDPFCIKVLQKHWPHVPRYGDVRKLRGDFLPPVDLLCGGFPCQPVSTAGRRKGTSDPRWLWPEFARLVGEMGPRYVFVENVPGLLSKGGTEVIADLAEMGFDAEWGVVAASAVGAPHIRERVFVMAYTRRVDRIGGEGAGSRARRSNRADDGREEAADHSRGFGEADAADPNRQSNGGLDRGREDEGGEGELAGDGEAMADTEVGSEWAGLRARRTTTIRWGRSSDGDLADHWAIDPADSPESGVGRVAYGVSNGVDRLRALGNAVVPQWAELMGRMILEMDQ